MNWNFSTVPLCPCILSPSVLGHLSILGWGKIRGQAIWNKISSPSVALQGYVTESGVAWYAMRDKYGSLPFCRRHFTVLTTCFASPLLWGVNDSELSGVVCRKLGYDIRPDLGWYATTRKHQLELFIYSNCCSRGEFSNLSVSWEIIHYH